MALFRVIDGNTPVDTPPVAATLRGENCLVQMRVAPASEIAKGFMLVVFNVRIAGKDAPAAAAHGAQEPVLQHLERELEQVNLNLRDTVEQYEASTEELKASNEELQAMNEELRSATEELETSREELQSINEELTTVNQEMTAKVNELAGINSDLQNLMASTEIATVFLDRNQAVTRYTPSAAELFNLIPGDVGRPLAHLKHHLDYPGLIADIEQVLRTLVPVEREVQGGHHVYFARIQPYRTLEDHIAGSVLTLVDVTERNRATGALRDSEERMRLLIESVKEYAIFSTDFARRIDSWNAGAETLFGYTADEVSGRLADELFTPEDRAEGDPAQEQARAQANGSAESERWLVRKDGSRFYGSGLVMPLGSNDGHSGFVKVIRDLTAAKRTDDTLREQMDELVEFNSAAIGRELRMIELKKEVNALSIRAGEPPRYALDSGVSDGEPAGG
jgi:two-component system CheB/CheR fusion protein